MFNKQVMSLAGGGLLLLAGGRCVHAAVSNWNTNNTAAGATVDNFNLPANWTGGFNPTNGNGFNVYLTWDRPNPGGPTDKVVTNSVTDVIVADSLSLTNSGKDFVEIYIQGQTFLTNGLGLLDLGGATFDSNGGLGLTFSNSVVFKNVNFNRTVGTGAAGSSSLTFAGATTGNQIVFNGPLGVNTLVISGPLNLSGALVVSNLNNTSFGTLSGNAILGRLLVNNSAANAFVISNSTTTLTGSVASVAGGFTLAHNATLTVGGSGGLILSNVAPVLNGTLNISNSVLNVLASLTNNGVITVSGSTATFNGNLTLTGSAILTADSDSILKLRGNFIDASTQSNAFNLLHAALSFDGGGGNETQLVTVAGLNFGAVESGLNNNFAIGSFTVGGSTGIVELVGSGGHALYVSNLTVLAGSTLLLDGFTIYTLEPSSIAGNVVANGGGAIVLIPEPATLTLVCGGAALLLLARKKKRAGSSDL